LTSSFHGDNDWVVKRRGEWVIAQRSGPALHLKRFSDLGPDDVFQESTFRAAPGIMDALSHDESVAREIYADLTGLRTDRLGQLDVHAWEAVKRAIERGRYVIRSANPRPDVATNVRLFTNSPNERNTHHYPATVREILALVKTAWPEIGETGARTLTAQWAHETRDGTNCWNYNMGNFKAPSAGVLHMYLRGVWEVVPTASAAKLIGGAGGLARLATANECRAKGWSHKSTQSVVVFDPPHEGARFRAFDSLAEGVQFWVGQHKDYGRRNPAHVPAIAAGDTATVAHVLKLVGYYTGSEPDYAAGMRLKKAQLDTVLGRP
jgi:hypothetical protein